MKENNSIIRKRFRDSEQEEYLKQLKYQLITYAELKGKEDGEKNLPVHQNQYMVNIHNHIQIHLQQGIDNNHERHQPVSGIISANQLQKTTDEIVHEITNSLNNDQFTLATLQGEAIRIGKPLMPKWFKRFENLVAGAFGVFEAIIVYDSLAGRLTSVALWAATIASILIGSIGIHVAAGYIRKANNSEQYKVRYALILCVGLMVSLALGFSRARMYNDHVNLGLQTNDISLNESTNVSGWTLAVISFAAFTVALGLAVRYWRTKEDMKREKEYYDKCDEIFQLNRDLQEKETRIHTIKNTSQEQFAEALSRFEFALAQEKDIISFANQVRQTYIERNVRFRTDGILPAFFINPPQFLFKTFFDHLKK